MTDQNLHDDTKNQEIEPEIAMDELENSLQQKTEEGASGNSEAEDSTEEEPEFIVDEEAELATPQVVRNLREKLKKAIEEKQAYLNNWQKDKAEFLNIRRRDEEAKQDFLKFAKMGVIEEVLPVLDSFDMAMANKTAWESIPKEWRVGVEGIYTQLAGILQKNGTAVIGTEGEVFDPNLHHSIGIVETTDSTTEDKIAEIMQKGYTINGKVIRPALVKVFEIKK
jgi:molecular chaperone GrpE